MVVYLSGSVFGLFVFDKEGRVLAEVLTYPDTAASVFEFREIGLGHTTDSVRSIAASIGSLGSEAVVVDNSSLAKALETTGVQASVDESSPEIKWFRTLHDSHLLETGKVSSETELQHFRHTVSLIVARGSVSMASGENDMLVKHAIDAIDEIDKSINVTAMRVREWYALYNPSVSRMVEDSHQLASILIEFENRSQITESSLLKLGIPESVAHSIVESTLEGVGGDLSKKDLEAIRTLAGAIEQLYAVRQNLEQYVQTMMIAVAPNTTALVGAIIGARLMSLAGSLRDLARRPSSTVQILGAEKALFRSLKTGTDPPKHGIIFQTPEIYSAPYWQRGKIARALAGKLSIAARIDAFSRRDVGQELRTSLDRRIEEIKQQNPEPPAPTTKPARKPPVRRMPRSRPVRDGPSRKRGGRRS